MSVIGSTQGVSSLPLMGSVLEELAGKDSTGIRSSQKIGILLSICHQPGITRKGLIAELDLRPGTVSSLVAELLSSGLVHEMAPEDRRERGRPEIPLVPHWSRWVAVSVYCVSLEMRAVLVNAGDQVLAETSVRAPSSATGDEIVELIDGLIETVVEKCPERSTLLGVTLAVPGLVDTKAQQWIFSARWPHLRHLSLGHIQNKLEAPFHLRRQIDVQLEHAMFRHPQLRDGNTLLFHWGYGIGGAFSSNGSIVRSSVGVFCQIGHTSVFPRSNRPCICGRIGCLEADAAWWALAPRVAEALKINPENEHDVALLADNKEVTEADYFRHAIEAVTYGVSHLQAILVPDRILMYGPFLQNERIFDTIAEGVRKAGPPLIADRTEMIPLDLSSAWNPNVGTLQHFAKAYTAEILSG